MQENLSEIVQPSHARVSCESHQGMRLFPFRAVAILLACSLALSNRQFSHTHNTHTHTHTRVKGTTMLQRFEKFNPDFKFLYKKQQVQMRTIRLPSDDS